MAAKKTRAEQAASKSYEEINKLKGEEGKQELIGYIKQMQYGMKRRIDSFNRAQITSQALIEFMRTRPVSIQLTKMSLNQLRYEYFRYQAFFEAKTSTVAGARKVNREQDIRIFGKDSRGKPKYTMSESQRKLFWETYDEYKNMFPADTNLIYSSERVQFMLADALYGNTPITPENLVSFLQRVRERLAEAKYEEEADDASTVFTGRWNPFED